VTLHELIEKLELLDPKMKISPAWGKSHSWRGSYEQVAFEPLPESTAGEMLSFAKAAVGSTLYGWKGGEYRCGLDTDCNVAGEGEYGGDSDDMGIWWTTHVQCAALRARVEALEAELARDLADEQLAIMDAETREEMADAEAARLRARVKELNSLVRRASQAMEHQRWAVEDSPETCLRCELEAALARGGEGE